RIAARLRAVEEPAVAAIRPAYAALALEGHARSHGGAPLSQYVFSLVWMIGPDIATPGGFFRGHTRVCEPLIADENVVTVRIRLVCKTRNRRDHRTETQFTLAQLLLGAYQVVNVRERTCPTHDAALSLVARQRAVEEPAVAFVRGPYAEAALQFCSRSYGGFISSLKVRRIIWMERPEKAPAGGFRCGHTR